MIYRGLTGDFSCFFFFGPWEHSRECFLFFAWKTDLVLKEKLGCVRILDWVLKGLLLREESGRIGEMCTI